MRVVSWTVNGIRAGVRHGFVDFVGPVRRRYRRRPGGPRTARGHPTGRPPPTGLAHRVHGRRAPGLERCRPLLEAPARPGGHTFPGRTAVRPRGAVRGGQRLLPQGKRPGPGQQPGRLQTRLLSDGLCPGATAQTPSPVDAQRLKPLHLLSLPPRPSGRRTGHRRSWRRKSSAISRSLPGRRP